MPVGAAVALELVGPAQDRGGRGARLALWPVLTSVTLLAALYALASGVLLADGGLFGDEPPDPVGATGWVVLSGLLVAYPVLLTVRLRRRRPPWGAWAQLGLVVAVLVVLVALLLGA